MASAPPFLGRGWAFPPRFAANGGAVEMAAGAEDVRQSLEILFATQPGERVMREDFGAGLDRFLFAEIDAALIAAVRGAITDAVLAYEPRIRLDEVALGEVPGEPGAVLVTLGYVLRETNARHNLVFPFYLREATSPR